MKTRSTYSAGFSLIEVTLALGIAAFCLLSVFGLLPLGLSNTQNASEQTIVSGIATAISSDLHSVSTISSSGTAGTPLYGIAMPQLGQASYGSPIQHTLFFTADGSLSGAADTNASASKGARYRATIEIQQDATLGGISNQTTLYKAWVLITWPALADPTANVLPSNFSGSYEYVTALNFNSN